MNEVFDRRGAGNVQRFPNWIVSEAREKVGETDGTDTAKEHSGHARAMEAHRKRGGGAGRFREPARRGARNGGPRPSRMASHRA